MNVWIYSVLQSFEVCFKIVLFFWRNVRRNAVELSVGVDRLAEFIHPFEKLNYVAFAKGYAWWDDIVMILLHSNIDDPSFLVQKAYDSLFNVFNDRIKGYGPMIIFMFMKMIFQHSKRTVFSYQNCTAMI